MVLILNCFITFNIGNGKGIILWRDKWVDRGCLCDLFPEVFKVVKDKDATITGSVGEDGWFCTFKRHLNENEQLEWDLLCRDLALPTLLEEDDEVNILENFNTQNCYEELDGALEYCNFENHLWKPNIPHRVSFILWDGFHNSLPTRDMLSHRRVEIESDVCVLCNSVGKTPEHLFIHCSFSFQIWDYFINAFRISWPLPGTLINIFDSWRNNMLQGRAGKNWQIIHYAICWIIWNERHGRVFGGWKKCVDELVDQVKSTVVLWSCDLDTLNFINLNLIWSNWDAVMNM